jgi:hypothetical protein
MTSAISRLVPSSPSLWPPVLLFKLQWLLLVPGREHFIALALLLLPLQALLLYRRLGLRAVTQALPFAVIGILLDQLLAIAGIFEFGPFHVPLHLALLWLAFAWTLPVLPLQSLTTGRLALLGAGLGVVGYGAGYWLGAVDFGLHPAWALVLLALCWAVLLPLRRWLLQLETGTATKSLLMGAVILAPFNSEAANEWNVIGQARFNVLWFTIYDAVLEAPTPEFRFPASTPYRLSLQYRRDVKPEQIVKATLDQWRQQQLVWSPEWESVLASTIPPVAEGDTLQLEVAADGTAALLHNNNETAQFTNREFVTAFAGIWLSERSTDPDFRLKLIGKTL